MSDLISRGVGHLGFLETIMARLELLEANYQLLHRAVAELVAREEKHNDPDVKCL